MRSTCFIHRISCVRLVFFWRTCSVDVWVRCFCPSRFPFVHVRPSSSPFPGCPAMYLPAACAALVTRSNAFIFPRVWIRARCVDASSWKCDGRRSRRSRTTFRRLGSRLQTPRRRRNSTVVEKCKNKATKKWCRSSGAGDERKERAPQPSTCETLANGVVHDEDQRDDGTMGMEENQSGNQERKEMGTRP